MSLMIVSRLSPEWRMVSTNSSCSAVSAVSSSSVVMPMTPFIGVRISWLMLARNSDFARVASSSLRLSAMSSRVGRRQLLLALAERAIRVVPLELIQIRARVKSDAGDELDLVRKLDEIVVRAGGERLALDRRILFGRQDDDRNVLR